MEKIIVALAMDAGGLEGRVSSLFGTARSLVLVESDCGKVLSIFERHDQADLALARRILDWNCECVLCGPLEAEPFLVIADEGGVSRYDASGLDFNEALRRFNSGTLPLIRDHIGGGGCQSGGGGHCREH